MFVAGGRRHVRKDFGRRAAFCPICRTIVASRIRGVHPAGRLDLLQVDATCESCGLWMPLSQDAVGLTSKDKRAGLDKLIAETIPDYDARFGPRLELEARVARGMITPEERAVLLREPILALNNVLSRRSGNVYFDGLSGSLMFVGIFGLIFLYLETLSQPQLRPLAAVFAVLTFGIAIARLVWEQRRYYRRKVLPMLARSIRPLHCSMADLEAALAWARQNGLKIARYLRPQSLIDELSRSRNSIG